MTDSRLNRFSVSGLCTKHGRESDLVCTDNEGDSTRGQVHVNHAARYIEDCLSQRRAGNRTPPSSDRAESRKSISITGP